MSSHFVVAAIHSPFIVECEIADAQLLCELTRENRPDAEWGITLAVAMNR
jgi:hypothetical protein